MHLLYDKSIIAEVRISLLIYLYTYINRDIYLMVNPIFQEYESISLIIYS